MNIEQFDKLTEALHNNPPLKFNFEKEEKEPTDYDVIKEAISNGELVKIIVDGTEMVANLLPTQCVEYFMDTYKGEYFIEYTKP